MVEINNTVRGKHCCVYKSKNRKMPSGLHRRGRRVDGGDKQATQGFFGLGVMPGV